QGRREQHLRCDRRHPLRRERPRPRAPRQSPGERFRHRSRAARSAAAPRRRRDQLLPGRPALRVGRRPGPALCRGGGRLRADRPPVPGPRIRRPRFREPRVRRQGVLQPQLRLALRRARLLDRSRQPLPGRRRRSPVPRLLDSRVALPGRGDGRSDLQVLIRDPSPTSAARWAAYGRLRFMPRHPHVAPSVAAMSGSVYSNVLHRLANFRGEVVPLSVGDTWMEPPEGARMEDIKVADHPGMHRYAPPQGLPDLLDLLADRLRARTGVATGRENILLTTGATGGLSTVAGAL